MHNLALAVASKAGYKVTGSDDEIFDPALSHLREAGLLPDEMGWHPERTLYIPADKRSDSVADFNNVSVCDKTVWAVL